MKLNVIIPKPIPKQFCLTLDEDEAKSLIMVAGKVSTGDKRGNDMEKIYHLLEPHVKSDFNNPVGGLQFKDEEC